MDELSADASIARLLTADGAPAGVGVLVGERQILTCAHVVNLALGRKADAQDRPDEVVLVDFPLTGVAEPTTAYVLRWVPPPSAGRAGDDIARHASTLERAGG